MTSKSVKQFVNNLTHPKGYMGDYAHAARLFVDDDMRLAPKLKFQFHTVFSINSAALRNLDFKFRHQTEINMLVKSVDLPKYSISTETLNQYNRKKVVQSKIDYTPVTLKFHDDNFGVTRQLWENYFMYYYADADAAKVYGNYRRNATEGSSSIGTPYGLDNNSSVPFFNNITIYQFAKHIWYSYTLINPIIQSWYHDTMDYSSSTPVEQTMILNYESVFYNAGYVQPNNPPGFATEHYDHSPSPLSVAGGGTTSIFGVGGVLDGVTQVAGDIISGTAFDNPLSFIGTAIKAINTYENASNITGAGIREELSNITRRTVESASRASNTTLNNTVFPINDTGNASTPATLRSITGL